MFGSTGLKWMVAAVIFLIIFPVVPSVAGQKDKLDPYVMRDAFDRFPLARVVPLDNGKAWGLMYADTHGNLHLNRATTEGWKQEWQLTSLNSKIRRFFYTDIEDDGVYEIIVATMNGRILIYSAADYSNLWENLEDDFTSIEAFDVRNIDNDVQLEFIFLADEILYIYDGVNQSMQWRSDRKFEASELIVENVDDDDQLEIILNTGVVIDTKFMTVEVEWDRPFGKRITVFDMNNDGFQEVIGEFSDYSLRIFDVYTRREVWY